jgi:hypothetical protein
MAPAVPPAAAEPVPAPAPADGAAPSPTPGQRKSQGDTNEIATLTITFRAVSLKNVSGQADADKGIAYTVLQELQSSPLFDSDPKETRTEGDVSNDEQTGTFTFSLVARLKRPLKL